MIERHLKRVNPHWGPFRLRQGGAGRVRLLRPLLDRGVPTAVACPTGPSCEASSRTASSATSSGAWPSGKGVILALPHLGGWEWAGRWLATRAPGHRRRRGDRAARAVRVVRPAAQRPRHDRRRRSVPGPRPRSSRRSARTRSSACSATATSPAAASRSSSSASARRCRPARPRSRCARARRSCPSASTSPGACTGTSPSCRPPLDTTRHGKFREDVARVTQDLAHELEYLIRRAPEQWHLFQPNWPSDPGYQAQQAK